MLANVRATDIQCQRSCAVCACVLPERPRLTYKRVRRACAHTRMLPARPVHTHTRSHTHACSQRHDREPVRDAVRQLLLLVGNKLIMHNRAEYAYTDTIQG